MHVEFTPFKIEHLDHFVPQEEQRGHFEELRVSQYLYECERHFAISGWMGRECLGAAGIIPAGKYRGVAWALLGHRAGPHMRSILAMMRKGIRGAPYRRVEFTTRAGFRPAQRLARLVGARLEAPAPLRFYGADGSDEYLYSIIKD